MAGLSKLWSRRPISTQLEDATAEGEEPEIVPVPEAPANDDEGDGGAKFKDGDKVRSLDPERMNGVVSGEPNEDRYAYRVVGSDGREYVETESQLEPDDGEGEEPTLPEEEPMEPTSQAPDFLISALGLQPGATLQECADCGANAIAGEKEADSAAMIAELKMAGCGPDLASMAASNITRADGETRADAAKAWLEAHPSARRKETSTESNPAEKPAATVPVPEQPAADQRAELPRNDDSEVNAPLSARQRNEAQNKANEQARKARVGG